MAAEPLVKFLIKYTRNSNGTVNTAETVFQTIPFAAGSWAILNPRVHGEIGKAGSFEFTLPYGHPLYNSLLQLKSIVTVIYAGNTIFRGRVLTVEKGSDLSHSVHCEGSFSFLLDSPQEGTKEETRPTIGVLQYLQQIISKHNSSVEADKHFTLGEVPGQYTSATSAEQRVVIPSDKANQQFGDSSWNFSMDRLEDLLNNFGGYFRVRYNASNGVSYLDWLDKYYASSVNTQPIAVAQNLINLSGTTEVDNIFTAVIPIGKNKSENVYIDSYWPIVSPGHAAVRHITVPELATLGLYSDAELNANYHRKSDYQNAIADHGWIWKQVDFENADTPDKLFAYAKDWIKNNYMPELTQWDVTALDLHCWDLTKQPLLVGDRVPLVHPEVEQPFGSFTVISADYDLYSMDKTKYRIGIPNQVVNASYGVKAKQEKQGKKGKGGGGGGITAKPSPDTKEEIDTSLDRLRAQLQQQYSLKTDWGQDITLDDPLAFFMYNTSGEKLDVKSSVNKLKKYNMDFLASSQKYSTPVKIFADAQKYGLDPDDPKTKSKLIMMDLGERNPAAAREQQQWKAQTEYFMVNSLELSMQEAEVLLNEQSGSSWLAGLVDDTGNWTPAAQAQGWGTVRAHSAEIKEMAINTRNLLTKKDTIPGTEVINGMRQYIVGGNLNLADYLNFDSDSLTFDVGSLFSTDGVKNIFKLISNAMNLDGEAGWAGIGKKANDWLVKLNDTFTYVDIDGVTRTVTNAVCAEDFNVPTIPSFKARFAYISDLIADRATINQLNAVSAEIESIKAKNITTDNLKTEIGKITLLQVNALTVSGGTTLDGTLTCNDTAYLSRIKFGGPSVGNAGFNDCIVSASVSNNVLTLNYAGGGKVTFSKATTLSGVWSGNRLTVTATPAVATPWSQALTRGTPTWDGSTLNLPVLYYTTDSTRPLGTAATLDVTSIYNDGYDDGASSVTPERHTHSGSLTYDSVETNSYGGTTVYTYHYHQSINTRSPIVSSGTRTVYW